MLYSSDAFSSNGLPTITRLDGSTFIGQRTALSAGDLEMIDDMYNCPPPVPPGPDVTATGPSYMGGNTMVTWTYTGNVPNVQSISWWYRKIGSAGSHYVIGYGTSGYFMAVADTFYSDAGFKTSDFEIYVKVTTTDGTIYTSGMYNIMKKGKWKLDSAL